MRRSGRAAAGAILLTVATVAAGTGTGAMVPAQAAKAKPHAGQGRLTARSLGLQTVPKRGAIRVAKPGVATANPLLSLTRDPSRTDMAAWRKKIAAKSEARSQKVSALSTDTGRLAVTEREPVAVRGRNDRLETAERLAGFGTGRRLTPAADVDGTLAPSAAESSFTPSKEDDGAIGLAKTVGLVPNARRTTTGTIGDGPHGSTSKHPTGDFDYYALPGLKAGQRLNVDIDTTASSRLDSVLVLWNAAGEAIAANDDDPAGSGDSLLGTVVPADGNYTVSVIGFGSFPDDPRDSGSGEGAATEGPYRVTFGLDATDRDVYAVDLAAGDVLSGSVDGAGTSLEVLDPDGQLVMGSSQDASSIYPMSSPLAGGGNAVVDHVAATAGRYSVAVDGTEGAYGLTLEAYRPGPQARRQTQTIFLDFDGQRVNTGAFGGPGVRRLSPLSAFLPRWGLTPAQEPALIDQITRTVTENLKKDYARSGIRVRVVDSRHVRDPFGKAAVSRVIVGGSIAEAGVETIGIAQSIDPGNFDLAETALVLLDVVSSPVDEGQDATLNSYLTPASDRVEFVGTALGNIVSHESGHFLGSWHVDQENEVADLMDQGGNFAALFGVGDDGIGGTADDPDVDFGQDTLNPDEGFSGTEDTAARTRFGAGAAR